MRGQFLNSILTILGGITNIFFFRAIDLWEGKSRIGLTAGASAPDVLIEEVVKQLREWGADEVIEADGIREKVVFSLPKELARVQATSSQA